MTLTLVINWALSIKTQLQSSCLSSLIYKCILGYFSVYKIHRILTRTTGSLTCVDYLFGCIYTQEGPRFIVSSERYRGCRNLGPLYWDPGAVRGSLFASRVGRYIYSLKCCHCCQKIISHCCLPSPLNFVNFVSQSSTSIRSEMQPWNAELRNWLGDDWVGYLLSRLNRRFVVVVCLFVFVVVVVLVFGLFCCLWLFDNNLSSCHRKI